MPSYYGIHDGDMEAIQSLLDDANVKQFGMFTEVLAAYIAGRMAGDPPEIAEQGALIEWDL